MPRLLDLFCGRWGWSRAFAARGWECIGVDLTQPAEIPDGCEFVLQDVSAVDDDWIRYVKPDAIVGSSPCENFSLFRMPHFHKSPPYPDLGIRLFNHARELCLNSGVPWLLENVAGAEAFVGHADRRCGPFYLWGTLVPPLLPQGVRKNMVMGSSKLVNELKRNGDREAIKAYRRKFDLTWNSSKSKARKEATAKAATIPPELANAVACYAEALRRPVAFEATIA